MADYLVQEEDGTSRFTLEEGGGSLLLEAGVTPEPEPESPVRGGLVGPPPRTRPLPPRPRQRPRLTLEAARAQLILYANPSPLEIKLPSPQPQRTLILRTTAAQAHTIYRAAPDHLTRTRQQADARLLEEIHFLTE